MGMEGEEESVREAWVTRPESRRPVLDYVEGYSEELVCMMLMALEKDENRRRSSSRLLEFVRAYVEGVWGEGGGGVGVGGVGF